MTNQTNFNLNHPEKHVDEIWLENVSKFSVDDDGDVLAVLTKSDWHNAFSVNTTYKTARIGDVAYDIHGHKMHGYYPVFVKRSEYANIHFSKT